MGIINTYDQLMEAREAGLPDVAVATMSRNTYRDGWKVWRPGFMVVGSSKDNPYDPDNGCRVFMENRSKPWKEARKEALDKALDWAARRYQVGSWKRNGMGDYVDARVNERFPLRKEAKR